MKIHFSLPKNMDFFNRYATLTPTIYKLGYLAQVVSAITESFVIYTLTYNRIYDLSPTWAPIAAAIASLIGTAFIELGLRKFIPYAIRSILFKRWQGLDLAMSIFIIAICTGLLFASGTLSFIGSKDSIKEIATTPLLIGTDSINQVHQSIKKDLVVSYRSDSAAVVNQFNNRVNAINLQYDKKLAIQDFRLNTYLRREKREGQSYHSRKESVKRKINELEADRANELATIELSKSDELDELLRTKKKRLNKALLSHENGITGIESRNAETLLTAKTKVNRHGNMLAWFTVICLVILVLSIILNEIYHKGSQINQVAQPNQYYFSQSIGSELLNMLSEKANYTIRNRIDKYAATTPNPSLPALPPLLYDLEALKQVPLQIRIKPKSEQPNYIELTQIHPQQARQSTSGTEFSISPVKEDPLQSEILSLMRHAIELARQNLIEESKKVQLKADQVIKAYLGEKATPENVDHLRSQIIGFLEGKNHNPFGHLQKRPIGFNPGSSQSPKNSVVTESYDQFTVEHKLEETGETVRYNLQQINARINNYDNRVEEGYRNLKKAQQDENYALIAKVLDGLWNRQNKLEYWIEKRNELLRKQNKL